MLNIIGRLGSRLAGFPIRGTAARTTVRTGRHDLPSHGVIPYVAGVLAEVTQWLPSRRDDGRPPLSAIRSAACLAQWATVMLNDAGADFALSR